MLIYRGTLLLLLLTSCAFLRADDDEPVFQKKRLSEWLHLLRGGEGRAARLTVPLAAGAASSHPSLWQGEVNPRRAAILALEIIGPLKSKLIIQATAGALRDDPSDRIREAAAHALGRMCVKARQEKVKYEEGRDALTIALGQDHAGKVREASAAALARLGPDAAPAVAALARALGDDYPGTRAAAADALRRLGKDAADALPELQRTARDRKADVLTRIQAVHALGRIGSGEGVPALVEALSDKSGPVTLREAAAEALGLLGQDATSGVDALASALIETSAPVELRRAAAAALDRLGPEARAALPAYKKALKDEDKFVRAFTMHACGRLGKELAGETHDVVVALILGVNDSVGEVRLAAIEALGILGPNISASDLTTVRERLGQASRDTQKAIRDAALDALKKLMM